MGQSKYVVVKCTQRNSFMRCKHYVRSNYNAWKKYAGLIKILKRNSWGKINNKGNESSRIARINSYFRTF